MRRFLIAASLVALVSSTGVSTLMADVGKGQKIYLKQYKAATGMSGGKFALLHTQDEWREMFEDEGMMFIDTYGKKFPRLSSRLQSDNAWKYLQHLRDFLIEYASDSGNVPSCG